MGRQTISLKLTMSALEKSPKRIKTLEDLSRVKFSHEREFARFLLNKNPHLIILYEPKKFLYLDERGIERGTVPDFLINNPKNSGKNIYVEMTLSPKKQTIFDDETKKVIRVIEDTKAGQKKAMKTVAPNERYVVLYAENMKKIQRKNPDFNPWNPKILQIEEKKDLVHTI